MPEISEAYNWEYRMQLGQQRASDRAQQAQSRADGAGGAIAGSQA